MMEPQTSAPAGNTNGTEAPQNLTVPLIPENPNGSASAPPSTTPNGISADEIALYDRQIRLWGLKAQESIRSANILLITMKALANEIAKNLVLAGINSLTICDHSPVSPSDLTTQFFLPQSPPPLNTNRAIAASTAIQRLNPRVTVNIDTVDIRLKPPSYYSAFDIIIATDLDAPTLNIINTATRLNNRKFYAAGSHGMYGFLFSDLIEHDFIISRAISNLPTNPGPESPTRSIISSAPSPTDPKLENVTKRELFSTWLLASSSPLPSEILKSHRRKKVVTPILSCLRALWEFEERFGCHPNPNDKAQLAQFTIMCGEQHKALGLPAETLRSETLRAFLMNIGGEIAPVVAVLGGQLAQDVINVLGRTQQPIQNFVVFDGEKMEAGVYALHPKEGELGRGLLPISGGQQTAAAAGSGEAGGGGNGIDLA
ncbi:putative DNA damage tolerance protein [Triangularia verruculosa]|uniref:Ubiquitin-like 1-activating enzyme E1A n=1 Tax=Triangularia verruculosa TaxID=2587418 RepID=A0AAN7AZM8_9PEZI|nr:putative DNA damage tolerance protein [Triangularia verruculosa]